MKYYLAPMEGITGYIYRNAYEKFFHNIDKYFTPFIVPNQSRSLKTKELRDILPENNQGMNIVPQILTNDSEGFIVTAKKLKQLGYNEVNLNLGCPAGTVVSKNRGSGFLALRDELDRFLEEIYKIEDMKISIKTRIGKDTPEEFYKLIEIYNKYPLEELIIHPRTREDFYGNTPNLEVFKDANYTIKNYSKNDIIALEGDICTCVGLILEGSIDIKRTLGTKVIHVSSFTKGHIFGEVIAFSDINLYPATVISASSSKIMFISKDNFIKYCTSHKDFLERFLNDLTNKIFVLNKSITNLTFNSIRQKICNFLITEYKLQKSYNIKLKMTKEKIAESLGITRPSLSRELINMKDEGLIDYSRNYIKILDLEEIEDILVQ